MEDELWEFLEKEIVPILSTSMTTSEYEVSKAASSELNETLFKYLKEIFLGLRGVALSEVHMHVVTYR